MNGNWNNKIGDLLVLQSLRYFFSSTEAKFSIVLIFMNFYSSLRNIENLSATLNDLEEE